MKLSVLVLTDGVRMFISVIHYTSLFIEITFLHENQMGLKIVKNNSET